MSLEPGGPHRTARRRWTPRRAVLTGEQALTPSEHRIAELAAAGHPNRHIAQTLFITPKTVEVHLSNAYRKLGVRNRLELARTISPKDQR
ncbi:helix-turn-helix transcriptional regulator [Sphaerisporangium sp. NPDC051017]|uniref:helix-turn-helix domain-containing protein n=1 Tax=Sphaerisporangium sp. NPDC051017 TaxID=3154636 RepID=UPI003447EB49